MIITQTPLRIGLAGGGTDLAAFYEKEEGVVLSSTINLFIYIAAHRVFHPEIILKYSQTEHVGSVGEIQHRLIRECMRECDFDEPIELTSFADIPSSGSGLGSSSAFSVGLVNALQAFRGKITSPEWCAQTACRVEIDRLGDPIGKQDQYAAAYGGMNLFVFRRDGSVAVERIPLRESDRDLLNERLVLFYTGITRSAGDILTEQKANTASSAEKFDNLCRMRDMAWELRDELCAGRIEAVGDFLRRGWEMKRTLAGKISNSTIDDMYDRAMKAGATGGKLLGAGGGGFLLFYCEPEKQADVKAALADLRHVPFRLEGQGTRVLFCQGT